MVKDIFSFKWKITLIFKVMRDGTFVALFPIEGLTFNNQGIP